MRRSLLALAAAGAGAAVLPAAGQAVLTVSSWVPPTHALSVAQKEWCERVEKNAGGQVRCNFLTRPVANPASMYDAVRNDLADVSFVVHGYAPGRFVLTRMAEFPFLGDEAEATSVAFNRVAMKHPAFLKEHPGVHVLAFFTHGPGLVFNGRRPVTSLQDLQGLKWWAGGGTVYDTSQALGLDVLLKPATDTPELLSRRRVDGVLFPAESVESFHIDRAVKYATTFPGGLYNTSFVFLMNQRAYEKLPPEGRKAVDAASGEVAARLFGRSWDNADLRALAILQAHDVQVTKADPKFVAEIKARTAPLEQKWVQAAKAEGLADPAKVLAEFRAEIVKAAK
jgi:TRAP-type C4-dicarboxylate transport system substrate-binding protein